MEQQDKYKTSGDKIIFSPIFDESLTPYYDTISKYHELIFDNLIFGDRTVRSSFNRKIDFLPDTLTTIIFNHHFNARVNFPNPSPSIWTDTIFSQTRTLKNITFGHCYNVYTELPPSLINLTFGHCFNKPIDFSENRVLTNIIFGEQFNQMIILPKNLLSLTICNKWNCRIILPDGLKHIHLGDESMFNFPIHQLIDNLPNSVEKIDFGRQHINSPTYNLPNSVREITMNVWTRDIKNIQCLPKYIDLLKINLILDTAHNETAVCTFGTSSHITTLDITISGGKNIVLPENVQNIVLNCHFDNVNFSMKNLIFGSNVLSLEIVSRYEIDLNCVNFQTMKYLEKLVVGQGQGQGQGCCGNYWDPLPKSLCVFKNKNTCYYKTYFGWISVFI